MRILCSAHTWWRVASVALGLGGVGAWKCGSLVDHGLGGARTWRRGVLVAQGLGNARSLDGAGAWLRSALGDTGLQCTQ